MISFFSQVTLPDVGINVGEFVTAAIDQLGLTVVVVVGGFFAFLVIAMGLRWAYVMGGFDEFGDEEFMTGGEIRKARRDGYQVVVGDRFEDGTYETYRRRSW